MAERKVFKKESGASLTFFLFQSLLFWRVAGCERLRSQRPVTWRSLGELTELIFWMSTFCRALGYVKVGSCK